MLNNQKYNPNLELHRAARTELKIRLVEKCFTNFMAMNQKDQEEFINKVNEAYKSHNK